MKRDSTAYGAVRPAWDKADCSVRALAVAAGCTYEVASAVFSAAGRKVGKGTPLTTSNKVHEDWLGMRQVEGVTGWPLAAFIAAYSKGRFVVHKRGHAFAVIDGVLHDWENTTKPGTEVQRVMEVMEVTLAKIAKVAALIG